MREDKNQECRTQSGEGLSGLLAMLEAATEGSLDLDGRIYCAINGLVFRSTGKDGRIHFDPDKAGTHTMLTPHPYTTSLDAALTLVPEGWFVCIFNEDSEHNWFCALHTNRHAKQVHSDFSFALDRPPRPPALALCIAALRARQSDQPSPPSALDTPTPLPPHPGEQVE